MQVLISTETATSKCQHRHRQPFVDRNRCVTGTTLICGVPSTTAAAEALATSHQSPDEPTMFATSGKARMRQQHDWCLRPIDTTSLPVAAAASNERRPSRAGSRWLDPAPETFVARLPECLAIDFLRLSLNLIGLPSQAGPAISALTRTCPRLQLCEFQNPDLRKTNMEGPDLHDRHRRCQNH